MFNKHHKVKGGALQLTIFIGVVILLLLFSFIMLVDTHSKLKVKRSMIEEVIRHSNNGINYAISTSVESRDSILLETQDDFDIATIIYKDQWGLFYTVYSKSSFKNIKFDKVALAGGFISELDRPSLYLEDLNRPLVVVGNTKIIGTAFLPELGVRTGNISGVSYYGDQLIYGNTKKSDRLPKLDYYIIEYLKKLSQISENLKPNQFLDLNGSNIFSNSFKNDVEVIFSPHEINIENQVISGHIIIQSETAIIIEKESVLKDIILIAPIIKIKDSVKGSFQAFACEQLIVGSNCDLNYPSVLALISNEENLQQSNTQFTDSLVVEKEMQLTIESGSRVSGIVSFIGATLVKNYDPQISINENAIVEGQIFCEGNLELKGEVHGSVYTNGFIAVEDGQRFQNHIYNGIIDCRKLKEQFVGLSWQEGRTKLVTWLY